MSFGVEKSNFGVKKGEFDSGNGFCVGKGIFGDGKVKIL